MYILSTKIFSSTGFFQIQLALKINEPNKWKPSAIYKICFLAFYFYRKIALQEPFENLVLFKNVFRIYIFGDSYLHLKWNGVRKMCMKINLRMSLIETFVDSPTSNFKWAVSERHLSTDARKYTPTRITHNYIYT